MNMIPYVYDFVSLVFENPDAKKYIKHVILFGSSVTGEFDKKSDIDIFINASDGSLKKLEPIIKEAEKRFYLSVEKKWSLLGMEFPIKYIIADLDTYRWEEIKSEIISTGMVLYGKYEALKEGMKHYIMFNYSLKKIKQNKKMEFIRKLFGYSQKRDKKTYKNEGVLSELGGFRLGNSILVPAEKAKEIQKIFSTFKVTPEIREIWIN